MYRCIKTCHITGRNINKFILNVLYQILVLFFKFPMSHAQIILYKLYKANWNDIPLEKFLQ